MDFDNMLTFMNELLDVLFNITQFQVALLETDSLKTFYSVSKNISHTKLTKEKNIMEQEIEENFENGKIYLIDQYKKQFLPSGFAVGETNDKKLFFMKSLINNQICLLSFVVPQEFIKNDTLTLLSQGRSRDFQKIFKQISYLMQFFVTNQVKFNKSQFVCMGISIIQEYIFQSDNIYVENTKNLFEKTFKLKAITSQDIIKLEEPNNQQIQIQLNFRNNKYYLLTNILREDINLFLQTRQFEKLMTEYYCRFEKKMKTYLQKLNFYRYHVKANHTLLMEFDKEGKLIFSSLEIPQEIQQQFGINTEDIVKQWDNPYNFKYKQIFAKNPQLISEISQLSQTKGIDQEFNYQENDFDLVGIYNLTDLLTGFQIYIKYKSSEIQEQIQVNTPICKINKFKKIQNCLHKITKMNKVANAFSFSVKANMIDTLKNQESESKLVEFLSGREQQRIFDSRAYKKRNSIKGNGTPSSSSIMKNIQDSFRYKDNSKKLSHKEQKLAIIEEVNLTEEQIFQQLSNFDLKSYDFNAFQYNPSEKYQIIGNIFESLDFIEQFQIPKQEFVNFIDQIKYQYNKRNNPFHNFDHGIQVMYGCYYISTQTVAKLHLTNQDKFSLILSGLCHDVNHTAHTNLFEANSMSKLAVRYNDRSVLENHHIATTFKILKDPKCNIFQNFDNQQLSEVRENIIQNILMTDNKEHFNNMKKFESLPPIEKLKDLKQDEIRVLTGIILHTSDFHGNSQKFELSRIWSNKVNEEFQAQYKLEGELEIPQTPYYKGLEDISVMAKGEIGFSKFIVTPLFIALNTYLQNNLQSAVENLQDTQQQWTQIVQQEEEKLNQENNNQQKKTESNNQ